MGSDGSSGLRTWEALTFWKFPDARASAEKSAYDFTVKYKDQDAPLVEFQNSVSVCDLVKYSPAPTFPFFSPCFIQVAIVVNVASA